MIDVRRLRSEPEYRAGIERKRVAPGLIDEVLAADEARRAMLGEVEELRARQNAASKEIGRAAPDERPAKIAAAAALKDDLAAREPLLAEAEARFNELVIRVPNPAHPSVPDGGEEDYDVLRTVGDPPAAPAAGLDHAELGERLGFVDTERAARMSGSRFAYLMGEAVLLEMALVHWVMGKLVAEGFTPVVPPVLVRESMMEAAGFFPTDRSQVYEVDGGELFLVGTSEVPLAGIHLGETLDEAALPSPLRRVLLLLPAGGGHLRQGHPGHLPGPPVRQGGDVQLRPPGHELGRARSHAGHRGVDRRRARPSLPGHRRRRRRPRRPGGQEVRHRGVAPVGGPLPGADVLLQLHRLLRPPARRPHEGRERDARCSTP